MKGNAIRGTPPGRVIPAPNVGRGFLPPNTPPVGVPDADAAPNGAFLADLMATMLGEMRGIFARASEEADTFDSYRPQSVGGESLTQLNLTLDYALQEVRTIIVTGPTINSPTGTIANPTPAQPAVPASGTAIQNPNAYPVNVVITGGALTAVTVNGVQVGTGDGTYLVPSGGTIALTYTSAPTWVWSDANPPATYTPTGTPFTLQLGGRAWPLLLPSNGILVERMNPGILLKRADQNQLISTVTGPWAVEVTGYRSDMT